MFADVESLARAYRAVIRAGKLSPRYLAYVAAFTDLYALFAPVVALGQRADDLLYRGWREREVRAPVYILASARSGTTLLHRLLCLDEPRFTHQKLYQTIFPAVSLYRAIEALVKLDGAAFGLAARAMDRIEKRAFRGFDGIHPMGLGDAEEDEALFVYPLLSPTLLMLFPFVDELDAARSIASLPAARRARLMEFYRDCLRRHLYAVGGDRTLLVKSVLAASRIDDLLETFPDARIIHLVRHPYESIPSSVSMLTRAWRAHSPEIATDGPEIRAFAQLMMSYYRIYAELEDRLPRDRFISMRYVDLVADPEASVRSIYERFGWTVSKELRERGSATATVASAASRASTRIASRSSGSRATTCAPARGPLRAVRLRALSGSARRRRRRRAGFRGSTRRRDSGPCGSTPVRPGSGSSTPRRSTSRRSPTRRTRRSGRVVLSQSQVNWKPPPSGTWNGGSWNTVVGSLQSQPGTS